MMVDLAPGWKTELERGPDWLFVRLYGPFGDTADAKGIAESISLMMQQDMVYRIVVELDGLSKMPSDLIRELCALREVVDREGGMLRLCGLHSEQDELEVRDFTRRFVPFRNREEAVLGFYRANKPR